MRELLPLGQMLAVHARLHGDRLGARDLERAMTFRQWDERSCRLANALLGLGLAKGDRVAVLAFNRVEWAEIYAATAKAGLVVVPINFRLLGPEVRFIVEDAGASVLIVQDELAGVVEAIRADLSFPPANLVHLGERPCPAGFRAYEDLVAAASDGEPGMPVAPSDPWTMMYTSGTTGNPKGVLRNHKGFALMSLVTEIELGVHRRDGALLVMPMCHANSLNFFGAFSYCGGATAIYSRSSFDPEHCVRTLAEGGSTFTSLVPTHYAMMLDLPAAVRARHDLGRVTKLMISSAPARPETKRAVMEMFRSSGLFELYGATETGWVTMLHPEEQFTKLGSVGRECVGSAPIRLLDDDGREVPDGEAGELFSCTPYTFDRYWKLPEKTREAFRGEYCSVGDMARRDADGYIHLVDRKSNMIISGGENVYPSEVETLLGAHPAIKDVAVVGLPDPKWGERVHAVVVLRDGSSLDEAGLLGWSRDRMAGYKRPRSCSFVREDEIPRNALGKVLHRTLKARLAAGATAPGASGA
jgi:fatty-acyl-CoA synthase